VIVADTNLLAYFLLRGAFTDLAERAYARDADWHAPLLWRSEFRNVLILHVRHGDLALEEAREILTDAVGLMQGREHTVDPLPVLDRAAVLGCTAYDAEFVALAERLGCRLVTSDRRLLAAAPHVAVSLDDFARDAT